MINLQPIVSYDPADPSTQVGRVELVASEVEHAVQHARRACSAWAARSLDDRADFLQRWSAVTAKHAEKLARLITLETGKVISESRQEVALLADKVSVTLEARVLARITGYDIPATQTRSNRCNYRPLGVVAVIGPFNFPAHLPNGHWVPALLAGNTVIFKPSERTPAVGALLGELMEEAGMPAGVFTVVQGRGDRAAELIAHADVDGVLFTGSWPVGRRIMEANLDRPGRMIALEMGGSNAAIVMDDANLLQAVIECVRCAYITSGQRCTCTRRIIVHEAIADRFISAFVACAKALAIGSGMSEPSPFMGPLISREARDAVLKYQSACMAAGDRALLLSEAPARTGWFVTPGLLQTERFTQETDAEVFGPIARISTSSSLSDAICQANATNFGLASSIFTLDQQMISTALSSLRSGCVNINCGTAGASGKLPFGGLGQSGNLRPAGAAMIDSCAVPIASMIETAAGFTLAPGMTAPTVV